MARRHKLQARDSVTGLMHYWTSGSPDSSGYPGPNDAEEVAIIATTGAESTDVVVDTSLLELVDGADPQSVTESIDPLLVARPAAYATMAALRAVTPVAGRAAGSTSYTQPGDGGAGQWVDVTGSPAAFAHNGGTVIVPASGAGSDGSRARKRVYSGPVDCRWFGAKGDDSTDNYAAIQAAIEAVADQQKTILADRPRTTGVVLIPAGIFRISQPLKLRPGVKIKGEGPASRIVEGPGFAGAGLILIEKAASAVTTWNQWFSVTDLSFESTAATAIKSIATVVINGTFERLIFSCPRCIILDTYTQKVTIRDIYSFGAVEQIVNIVGNDNIIDTLDKEGATGTSTEPYVYVRGSMVTLRHILLEGTGHVNKAPMRLDTCGHVNIDGYWTELTAYNGHMIEIVNTVFANITGNHFRLLKAIHKVYVRASEVSFERISAANDDVPWTDCFDVDADSRVSFRHLESRRGTNTTKLGDLRWKIGTHTSFARSLVGTPNAGLPSETQTIALAQGNLLTNPSFEAGMYGWVTNGTATPTVSVVASEVSDGRMLRCDWTGGTAIGLFQNFAITADMIGRELVFSAKVRHESANADSRVQAQAYGAGISSLGVSGLYYEQTTPGSGWHLLKIVIVPAEAGALSVGIASYISTTGTFYVDDCQLGFGNVAGGSIGKYQSIELGGRTVISASAYPTTGTWKLNDLTINTDSSTNGIWGWVCVNVTGSGVWAPIQLAMATVRLTTEKTVQVSDFGNLVIFTSSGIYTLAHVGQTFGSTLRPIVTLHARGGEITIDPDGGTFTGNSTVAMGTTATLLKVDDTNNWERLS